MDTNKVVEMIDAITEGREFSTSWEPMAGETLHILTRDDSFVISMSNVPNIVSLGDTRTAREIAGALVAWANRKEGKIDVANRARSLVDVLVPAGAEFPSVSDWSDINSGRITREEWYKLHVVNMTPESIERNIKALKEASREWAQSSPKFHDTQKALNILNEALKQTVSKADWYRRNVGRMTLETKRRNYNDLHKIRKTMSGGSLEWEDVTKAMQILEESINTHKEPDKNV